MVVDGSRRRLSHALTPVAAVCAALFVAGCDAGSGSSGASAGPGTLVVPTTASSTASPSPTGPTAPLTGLPVAAGVEDRAAVAVAMSLPAGSSPSGLDAADVVYEAWLDHGGTRLVPVFQSRDPAKAGPVGGTLPSDAQLLSVLHPVLADTGGSRGFVQTLQVSEVLDAPATAPGHGYTGTSTVLAAVPSQLRQAAAAASAPPPLFTWDDGGVTRNLAAAATKLTITAPGRRTEVWSYDAGTRHWRRADTSGISAEVTNLVLQTVPYEQVLLHHPGTATVPVARVLGNGRAVVLTGPAVVRATWNKPGLASVTNFVDGSDVPVWFSPGATWVTLISPGSRVTVQ